MGLMGVMGLMRQMGDLGNMGLIGSEIQKISSEKNKISSTLIKNSSEVNFFLLGVIFLRLDGFLWKWVFFPNNGVRRGSFLERF